MKKVLAYTFVAVLLGVVTMLAPFTLFVSEMGANGMDTQAKRSYSSPTEYLQGEPSKIEQTYGIEPISRPADIMFIVFLPVVSLVIALSVTSYFKRKTFSSSLP